MVMKLIRKPIFALAAIIILIPLFSTGCAPAPQGNFTDGWMYAPAQQNDTWNDASSKKYIPLSDKLNNIDIASLLPGKKGFIWLRKDFSIPEHLKDKELSVLLGRIMLADETWLNGEIIGRTGKFPPNFFSGWNTLRNYHIQNALLKENGNMLLIKIYCESEGGVSGEISLGEELPNNTVTQTDNLFNTFINLITSFIMLVFGGYHLIIYYNRPKDRENLFFALLCFCSSLYQTNFFITLLPGFEDLNISYIMFQKIIFSTLTIIYFLATYFIRDFFRLQSGKKIQTAFVLLTSLDIIAIICAPNYSSFILIRNISQLLFIPYCIYIIVTLIRSIQNKNKEALFIFIAGVIMCCLIGYDIVYHIFLKVHRGAYLGGIGFIVFLLALAAILARRFAAYRNEIEELNISLEHKVLERTSELTLLNQEMNAANSALKDTQKKIMAMASTDPLTGLHNRQELARKLKEEQIKLDRTKNGTDTAVLFIDLDNFKYINDTFGHAAGDATLTRFAEILISSCRAVDFIARFGGDEFVIIMFAPKTEGPAILAQRILDDIATGQLISYIVEGLKNPPQTPKDKLLACSIGISIWKAGMSMDNMMNTADRALYDAKKAGKNRFIEI